jgi:hypothetical protein
MSLRSGTKLNIIIAGYMVGGPLGGLVWHHLQYVLALQQMGHNVLFIEDSLDYPSCYNPQTYQISSDPSYGLAFIQEVFTQHGLAGQWAYFHQPSNQWYGKSTSEVYAFIKGADLLLNLSGLNPLREPLASIPVRLFVDTDPAFTQLRHLTEPDAMTLARQHSHFFSFGENIGKEECSIPDDGFHWQPTRQPVIMEAWPFTPGDKESKWTTVMQWDSYKVRQYNGRTFGMKSACFDSYLSLPGSINDRLELALGSATAPREKLQQAGWDITDPLPVTLTPGTYQQYIRQSKGEWSVAKHGYVVSRSGWFSERSAGYLASGRPVVVQNTGFSDILETGKGLLAFSSLKEAVEAIETVNKDYSLHTHAARELAEEYFRADKVLNNILNKI